MNVEQRKIINAWSEDFQKWLESKNPETPYCLFWSGRMSMCLSTMNLNPTLYSLNFWYPILFACKEEYDYMIINNKQNKAFIEAVVSEPIQIKEGKKKRGGVNNRKAPPPPPEPKPQNSDKYQDEILRLHEKAIKDHYEKNIKVNQIK